MRGFPLSLKIGFAGTPEFARVALETLQGAGFDVRLLALQVEDYCGKRCSQCHLNERQAKGVPVQKGLPECGQPRIAGLFLFTT